MKIVHADLHNHTTESDGDLTPEQIVELAARKRLKVIGITDHDTVAGLERALSAGEKLSIKVIPGVEVSIRFIKSGYIGTLHLLCYFRSLLLKDNEFKNEITSILSKGRGVELVNQRVKRINKVFGPKGKTPYLKKELKAEDVLSLSSNASRRHFALALKDKYDISDEKIIMQIVGNESPAYLPSGIDLDDLALFLKKYNIVTVLAHPAAGSFPGQGHYREVLPPLHVVEKLLPEFLKIGLQGIEVYYPGHIKEHEELILSWAKKYNLLITGGSDCHDKDNRPLGVAGISKEDFLKLEERIK